MEKKSIVALSSNVNLLRAFRDELVAAGVPENKEWNDHLDDPKCPIESVYYHTDNKYVQFHNHDTSARIRYKLPQDWAAAFKDIVATHAATVQENPYKIKVGDRLSANMLDHPDTLQICTDSNNDDTNKWHNGEAGDGYGDDRVVDAIEFIEGKWAAKVSECLGDWWVALESVEAYENFKVCIGEWEAKIYEDAIEVGCQTIDKAEVEAMYRMTQSPINAKIEIHGTEITEELLERILEKMENA